MRGVRRLVADAMMAAATVLIDAACWLDPVKLPALAGVGRIDDHASPVRAEMRMRVAAPFARVCRRQVEVAQDDLPPGGHVIQEYGLVALAVGIGVAQDPLVAGQI